MDVKELKKELLKDRDFRKEYYNKDDMAFEISEMVIDLRLETGLTQKQLAERTNTHQSSIARLEGGKVLPSLSFLQKIAKAAGTKLIPPKFELLEETSRTSSFALEDESRFQEQNLKPIEVFTPKTRTKEKEFKINFTNLPYATHLDCNLRKINNR